MPEPIDVIREELRNYQTQIDGDEVHIHDFVDFAANRVDEAFPHRKFTRSLIRNSLETLHRKDEIHYTGGGNYRIRNLDSEVLREDVPERGEKQGVPKDIPCDDEDDSSIQDPIIDQMMDDLDI